MIRQNSFIHLSVCEELSLGSNKIHTIESGAWNGLNSFRELTLSSNELEVLQPGMLSGLYDCTDLQLNRNKIHTIQSETFKDGLSSLQTLNLHENKIEEITQGTFVGLTQCTHLSLSSNKIHTIHIGGLEGMDSLTKLYLYNNELITLFWTVFGNEPPSQLTLALSYPYTPPDNPWACNSSLCWIKHGEQDGWLTWGTWIGTVHKPQCSNTNTDWDDVVLDCDSYQGE